MPLAYFNYCRDIIRHKWPFRGFYRCWVALLETQACYTIELLDCGPLNGIEGVIPEYSFLNIDTTSTSSRKESLMCPTILHLLQNPMSYYLVEQSFLLSCSSMRLSSPCFVWLFQIFSPVSRMHFLFIWHFLFVPSYYLPNIIFLLEFSPSF